MRVCQQYSNTGSSSTYLALGCAAGTEVCTLLGSYGNLWTVMALLEQSRAVQSRAGPNRAPQQ